MKKSPKNIWRVGSTTFNRSDMINSIYEFTKILNHFRNIYTGSWREEQGKFLDFIEKNYPDLLDSTKEKAEIARQVTAALINFNLFDSERKINKNGEMLLNPTDEIINIANTYNLDYKNVVYTSAISNIISENGEYKPIDILIKYLMDKEEVTLNNLLWSHKAENYSEMIGIISGVSISNYLADEPDKDLTEEIIGNNYFHNNNGLQLNNDIKIIYKTALKKHFYNDNEFDGLIVKLQINKMKKIYKNVKFRLEEHGKVFKNYSEFNRIIVAAIGEVYWLTTVKGQVTQTKGALIMMGIFNFEKRNKEIYVSLNTQKVYKIQSYGKLTNGIELINSTIKKRESPINFDGNMPIKISNLIDEYNIFKLFENDELFLIREFPQELLINMKSYVLLEYLTGIKLSKILAKGYTHFFNDSRLDSDGVLLAHAPGGGPDFTTENFIVEVTNSSKKGTLKLETEPVTRHLASKVMENEKQFCLFFGKDKIDDNFILDSLQKKNFLYFASHNKEKKLLMGLTIIVSKIANLDNLTIDNIQIAKKFHDNFFLDRENVSKSINNYRRSIDEIFTKK